MRVGQRGAVCAGAAACTHGGSPGPPVRSDAGQPAGLPPSAEESAVDSMGGRPKGVRLSTPARLRTVAIRYLSGTYSQHSARSCDCVAAQYDMLLLSTPQRSSCAAAIMQRAVAAPSLPALPRPSVSVASERSWQSQPLPVCDHSGLLSARRLGVLCAAGAHSLEHSFYVSRAHLPHDVAQQHNVRLHARQSEVREP